MGCVCKKQDQANVDENLNLGNQTENNVLDELKEEDRAAEAKASVVEALPEEEKPLDKKEDNIDKETMNTELPKPSNDNDKSKIEGSRIEGSRKGSKNGTSKKKKKTVAEEYVEEFNILRTTPKEYIPKVEALLENIQPNEGKKGFLYVQEKIPKVTLNKGVPFFKEFISQLSEMEPIGKLTVKKELNLEIPEQEDYKTEFINELFAKKKEELKDTKYKNITCHFDIGSSNAAVSVALQAVDDSNFKGTRRANILNKAFKYVGTGTQKVKAKHYCFFVFAE